ncbi:Asp-tRNA(Asn)/Glu-tRNA(Gln) amidotransferase subunit GatB [Ureaplasma canigenitalium]|uniref:Asp-tRNA(Asn)/Glu-tRNA(Gln) amidotransferase subunit GatB n=1 Tax=Ureaplasma canigenitalium TaxID=42092 RepID=UPI000571D6FA|nr:Asp-tRNA(Asn)/Glu-tRNA(Gln) amidotransferase subunit GatB [Ureaplasma canigenitalium]
MNNFEVIIGIEVHTALNTKTKMFSPSVCDHNSAVNTNINPVDLAHIGTLPTVNRSAVNKGIKLASALHMETNHKNISFDRKHYYYLDLPKGYQITQQYNPIGQNGYLTILDESNNMKEIRIERIHLEEDTAKQMTIENEVYLDYNRAGWPLIEIVSKPDIRSGYEAMKYLEELRKILLLNNISDAKLEDGSMRADVNISVRLHGEKKFGTKVEIKNINSFNNVKKAIDFEVKRQIGLILNNKQVDQETRRFDDSVNQTIFMRKKDNAINYRYIFEGNITPISLSDEYKNEVIKDVVYIDELVKTLTENGLNGKEINILLNDIDLYRAFIFVNEKINNMKISFNWLAIEVYGLINKQNQKLTDLPSFFLAHLAEMLTLLINKEINGKQAKSLLEHIFKTEKTPRELIIELGYEQIKDEQVLLKLIEEIVLETKNAETIYYENKDRLFKAIMGSLMKKTNGQANPSISYDLVEKYFKEKYPDGSDSKSDE